MSKSLFENLSVSDIVRLAERGLGEGKLLGDAPIEMDSTPVRVRGGSVPANIWWRGRQWAVTAYGIEALDGTYTLQANRLAENIDAHAWPSHMAEKAWVDLPDFMTAWLVALSCTASRPKGRAGQLWGLGFIRPGT